MTALVEAADVQEVLRRLRACRHQYVWYLTPGGMLHGERDGLTYTPLSAAFDLPMCEARVYGLPREESLPHFIDMVMAGDNNIDYPYDPDLRVAFLCVCGISEVTHA